MATKPHADFKANLADELNFCGARVMNKIRKNFRRLLISSPQYQKNPEHYTQGLYRSVYWTVHNASGGNPAMIKFFYMKYGDFVQWGVGRKYGDPRWPEGQKLWNVPPVTGKGKEPIKQTEGFNYASKPFLRREIMYHLSWLTKRLAEQYGYFGQYWLERSLTEAPTGLERTRSWLKEHMWELPQDFLDLFDMKRI